MMPLPYPPAFLADVPDAALRPSGRSRNDLSTRVLRALAHRGITSRPTLEEIEAERTRRGWRPGLRLTTGAGPAPVARPVLPMLDPKAIYLPETSEESRANRARITLARLGLEERLDRLDAAA